MFAMSWKATIARKFTNPPAFNNSNVINTHFAHVLLATSKITFLCNEASLHSLCHFISTKF